MLIRKESGLKISMIVTGFTALLVQIIYLREFLNVFSGNELIVGIILGNWMFLTASGARLLSRLAKGISNIKKIMTSQFVIAFVIPVSVVSIYWAKAHFYPPGTLLAFYESGLFCLLIMAPFCLVSGGLFTLLADEISQISVSQQAPKVYGFEALGSVIAGLLFTFVMLQLLTTFKIIFVVSAINIFAALLLMPAQQFLKVKSLAMMVCVFILLAIPFFVDIDALSKSFIYKNQNIVMMEDAPFGNLVVTQTANQYNFFENGMNLFSTDNLIANEEAVHYAMLQHRNPKTVLVVSGDISGMAKEIYKYDIDQIDYVEVNRELVQAMANFVGIPDKKINVHVVDARTYMAETGTKYDVVFLNLPPPGSLQLNRFYSTEFFSGIKQILKPGGVISLPVEGGSNYLSDEAIELLGILQNTLNLNFKNVLLYPVQRNYFLASDEELSYEIVSKLSMIKLENEFVNSYYINDALTIGRAHSIMESMGSKAAINKDFRPVAFYSQIKYWLSWYGQSFWWIIGMIAIGLTTMFVFSKPINKSLLVTGFSASIVEVVILMAFQIYFGQLYQALALLISGFMVGIAAGTLFAERNVSRIKFSWYFKNQGLIGLLSLMLILYVVFMQGLSLPDYSIKVFFYGSMLIFGSLTGMQFSFALKLQKAGGTSISSSAYAADLLGAAGGAILTSVLLIPLLGLPTIALLLLGLNLAVMLWLKIKLKVY